MDTINELFSDHQRNLLKDQGSPTPLYFQLYTLLKNSILNGTMAKGSQMPTEQQLAESFSVSRITAKRAMDELAAEDLVERRRGKGTHVIYRYKPQPVQAPLVGMLQEIESMARHSDVEVIACDSMHPPRNVREELAMEENDMALHLVRVRSRSDKPFAYYTSWTTHLAEKVTKADLQSTPRLEIFRKQGLEIAHITQTISAVAASEDLAKSLQTNVGSPLLSLIRRSYSKIDGEEVLVDYLHAFYHPDRFQYQMDLKPDDV